MTLPYFFIFVIISPLRRTWPFFFNKLAFPLPRDNLHEAWLNLACWFWRRRFLKIFSVYLLFCYYLPLKRDNPLNLNKLESLPPKDDLYQVWLKLVQWFWRRSRKCKSLQTDRRIDGQTDDGQPAIRKAHLSFQLRWAKKKKQTKPHNTKINYTLPILQRKFGLLVKLIFV
jgi:hypothetical protein